MIFFLRKVSLEIENITGVDYFLRRKYQQCHFSGVKYQTRYFSKRKMWIVIGSKTDMFSVRNITCKEKFTFDIFLMKNGNHIFPEKNCHMWKKTFLEKNVSSETFLEENISSCMYFYRKSSRVIFSWTKTLTIFYLRKKIAIMWYGNITSNIFWKIISPVIFF